MSVETDKFIGAVRRMLRAAAIRVGRDGDEPELADLLELQTVLEEAIAAAVDGQRARGKSWAAIAAATGSSRQAAQMRWGERKTG